MHFTAQTILSHQTQHAHRTPVPRTARGGAVVVTLFLAACAHSPQAAVSPAVADDVTSVQSTSLTGSLRCPETSRAPDMLKKVTQELQSHGMVLKASCQPVSGGWVMNVGVVDGVKARKAVRGPLADGHDVDMGTPAGVSLAGAAAATGGFSPDVQHNRQWLHALMARHQFHNLPDAWWHFAQRRAVPVPLADTDLAAR